MVVVWNEKTPSHLCTWVISGKCKSLQTRPPCHCPLASMDLHSPLLFHTDLCLPSTLLSFRYRELLVLRLSPLIPNLTHSPFIRSCLDHLAVTGMLNVMQLMMFYRSENMSWGLIQIDNDIPSQEQNDVEGRGKIPPLLGPLIGVACEERDCYFCFR